MLKKLIDMLIIKLAALDLFIYLDSFHESLSSCEASREDNIAKGARREREMKKGVLGEE
jgi:hypothetical protein